jgi:5-methylcytosine-specific restriction enzyme A
VATQTICGAPGCSILTAQRFCEKHISNADSRKQYDRARRSDPLRRLYNTTLWRRIRIYVLGRDPLCRIGTLCVERDGHPAPSVVVDHVVRARAVADPYDTDNLQGACKACHDRKTAMEDSAFAHSNV